MAADPPELNQINMNLLPTLRALLEEESVTQAAERLHLTQSAVSKALGQLRDLFDDPLLIRDGSSMRLTARAESLRRPLRRTMEELRELVHGEFDPATARRTFRVALSDFAASILLPRHFGALARRAPGICFVVVPYRGGDHGDDLRRGRVDLYVGRAADGDDLVSETLFESSYVCICREGHPASRAPFDPEALVAHPHVVLSFSEGHATSPLDALLTSRSLYRKVWVRTPYFASAGPLVAESDALAVVPRALAEMLALTSPIAILELPLPLRDAKVSAVSLADGAADAGLRWLLGSLRAFFER